MRICVLSEGGTEVLGFLDNAPPFGFHYYDDELHTYLEGAAGTFTFKVDVRNYYKAPYKRIENSDITYMLMAGHQLSFKYNGRNYLFTIMQSVQNETTIEVTAYSLTRELLTKNATPFSVVTTKTFIELMNLSGLTATTKFTIGRNEISSKKKNGEWTNTDETILARLFSLANTFNAELEFVVSLNKDYTPNKIKMNIYKANKDKKLGVGKVRDDIVFRYGKQISGIRKTVDITNLYTAIIPIGNNGIDITSIAAYTEKNEKGKIVYRHKANSNMIYAPQIAKQYPACLMNDNTSVENTLTVDYWQADYNEEQNLFNFALERLKEISKPVITYEIDGYVDASIGDIVIIVDEAYNPTLSIQARVIEQIESITNPRNNKTVFEHYNEYDPGESIDEIFPDAD